MRVLQGPCKRNYDSHTNLVGTMQETHKGLTGLSEDAFEESPAAPQNQRMCEDVHKVNTKYVDGLLEPVCSCG